MPVGGRTLENSVRPGNTPGPPDAIATNIPLRYRSAGCHTGTFMSHQSAGSSTLAGSDWEAIVRHYEECLIKFGATPRGVDWPNGVDLAARFGVMLGLLHEAGETPSILDLGCGPGLLLDYLAAMGGLGAVRYQGIDLSAPIVDAARARWPHHQFSCRDIVEAPLPEQSVDIVIMNGVLTERVLLSVETMTTLAQRLVAAAFRIARVGIAFNVMNAHVDWQRDDLFHWPFDAVAGFLKREVSRHYTFRADYALYEYTCFVRRQPRRPTAPSTATWWIK
jgi:SAM-dependent methyltransferase